MLPQKYILHVLLKRCLYTLILTSGLLVACAQPPAAAPASTAVAVPTQNATETAAATIESPTETAVPTTDAAAEATDTPPATITEEPAATTASPTETAVPATATATDAAATAAPPTFTPTAALEAATTITATEVMTTPIAVASPATGVTQPPYEASACSDRYPCNDDMAGWEERIQVPTGFTDTYFAHIQGQPTSITFGPDGRLYVAVQAGTIYALDASGAASIYASGFNTPTGIAFQPGTNNLYVSSRLINENVGGEAQVSIANGRQILSGLPCCYTFFHSANGIAFGPDGYGYVPVGGRADHGEILDGSGRQDERDDIEASILRFSPDGSSVETYARGFRNSYDIAWDGNGQLFASDNAPDYGPPEEFHRVVPGGEHGYPWYDCETCFTAPPEVAIVPPVHQFIPHSAPTGVTAYLSEQFPGYYNSLFVTLWSAFPGAQKVVRFGPGGVGASDFAMGFAAPIDVTAGPDGSLYVADWATGIIFKISYTG